VQPTSPKIQAEEDKGGAANTLREASRQARITKGGQSYYYGGNNTTGYIIIPPQLVFTEQKITFNV
jgi:hypothetical protein